jgi:hypothetical protein
VPPEMVGARKLSALDRASTISRRLRPGSTGFIAYACLGERKILGRSNASLRRATVSSAVNGASGSIPFAGSDMSIGVEK